MNTSHPKQIKNKLEKLSPRIFKDSPVLFAYLFGSFVSGAVHPFSDIDIAVYVDHVFIENSLELELNLSLEIDKKLQDKAKSEVRIINQLPLVLKGKIVTDGALIYSVDDAERVQFETSVRRAHFDFMPVIRNYQKTYLENAVT